MKLLIILDTLAVGGAETSTLAIVRELVPAGHSVIVATLYGGGGLVPQFEATGATVVVHDLRRKYGFWRGQRYLRSLLDRTAPDLVHASLFRSEIVARLALLGSPLPLINSFVNDSYSKYHYGLKRSPLGKAKLFGIQLIDFITKGRVDHFTAITSSTKDENARALRVPAHNISVIYRGRSVAAHPAQQPRAATAAGLTFLTTSRLIWRKGYREALTAIAGLEGEGIRYLIAGDGVDAAAIKQYAAGLAHRERFEFLGEVSDVTSLYPRADFFLMPSHYEGLGGALIEAMLAKIPIIASDIPVFHEVTDENALFFRVTDAQKLRGLLQQLDNRDQYRDMVERAYQTARRRYDISEVAQETLALYQRVADQKQQRK
ncbi:glycosyltransferase family 4 protein [Neolewinella sp.]|uniref:glycosyltransferase family 4 protein n=1 Tax=Neolewinella sp. TaxID=2993543 RepID=UPI003B52BAE6